MTEYSHLFTFAAAGIQSYIFEDHRLQQMVGASRIVDELPSGFLEALIQACGAEGRTKVISRAAGAARVLCAGEAVAQQLARLIPILVAQFAPGLPVTTAVVAISGRPLGVVLEAATKESIASRNRPQPVLPEYTGLLHKDAATGDPLFKIKEREEFSLCAWAKQKEYELSDRNYFQFLEAKNHEFALNFTDIAAADSGHYMAVVHADINSLGDTVIKFLKRLNDMEFDEAVQKYTDFSKGLSECAQGAMKAAFKDLKAKFQDQGKTEYPFRPLICAGDDLTYVIRSDLALDFTCTAIRALTQGAKDLFKELEIESSPTAAAGVVMVHSKYPFSQAYAMAEHLCAFAKKGSQRAYSSLVFHRHTTTLLPDEFKKHRTVQVAGEHTFLLTAAPYAVEDCTAGSESISMDQIEALGAALNELPRGSIRGLITCMHEQPHLLQKEWDRVWEMLRRRNQRKKAETVWKAFESLMKVSNHGDVFTPPSLFLSGDLQRTVLFDAMELNVINGKSAKPVQS